MKRLPVGLRILFSLCALGILFYLLSHPEEKDADIVFIVGMTALTFPVGIIVTLTVTAILALVLVLTGIQVPNSVSFYFVVWPIYAVGGYLQWFYVLPGIRRRRVGSDRGDHANQ